MDSTVIIIGMATTTAVSATVQLILRSLGKFDESLIVDFSTKCLLVATATASFASVIKALKTMF